MMQTQCARPLLVVAIAAASVGACGTTGTPREEERPAVSIAQALAWRELATVAADVPTSNDRFGKAVALSSDTMIVGAPGTAPGGAAFVFTMTGSTFTLSQKLVANGAANADGFGAAVAIDGDAAVIGASGRGAAFVFRRAGGTWYQAAELLPNPRVAADDFGSAVSVSGPTIVVGAPWRNGSFGAAYVFTSNAGTWGRGVELVSSDLAELDQFGVAVAVSGDTMLLGAHRKSSGQGAVYSFSRAGVTWTEREKLVASDPTFGAFFGSAVSLSGNTAVVGAYGKSLTGAPGGGAAYAFTRADAGADWVEKKRLTAADAALDDEFGASISLDGRLVIVGARRKGAKRGAAYVFDVATWSEKQKLVAVTPATEELYGCAVAVRGDTMVIGGPSDPFVMLPGRAHVQRLAKNEGEACGAPLECLSAFCVDGFCCDRACGGSDTADCQACSVAAGAITNGKCTTLTASRVCRSARSECDVDDRCDGAGITCPADVVRTNGAACGAEASGERCLGGACVADGGKPPDRDLAPPAGASGDGAREGCSAVRSSIDTSRAASGVAIAAFAATVAALRRRRRARPPCGAGDRS